MNEITKTLAKSWGSYRCESVNKSDLRERERNEFTGKKIFCESSSQDWMFETYTCTLTRRQNNIETTNCKSLGNVFSYASEFSSETPVRIPFRSANALKYLSTVYVKKKFIQTINTSQQTLYEQYLRVFVFVQRHIW